jgi:hypothetical protein
LLGAAKHRLGRFPGNHGICNLIRVPFIFISDLADPTCELHSSPLLHDVGCFVRCCVQVRWAVECNVVPRRKRYRSHVMTGSRRGSTDVGPDTADMVRSERALDLIQKRQGRGGSGDALGRKPVDSLHAWPLTRLPLKTRWLARLLLHETRRDCIVGLAQQRAATRLTGFDGGAEDRGSSP